MQTISSLAKMVVRILLTTSAVLAILAMLRVRSEIRIRRGSELMQHHDSELDASSADAGARLN